MDKQEIFDIAMEHLLRQGRRSIIRSGTCAYRGKDEMRCAVGFFIPDAMYSRLMENRDVGILIQGYEDKLYLLPDEILKNRSIFMELQKLHDSYFCLSNFDGGNNEFYTYAQKITRTFELEWKDWENWTPDRNSNVKVETGR